MVSLRFRIFNFINFHWCILIVYVNEMIVIGLILKKHTTYGITIDLYFCWYHYVFVGITKVWYQFSDKILINCKRSEGTQRVLAERTRSFSCIYKNRRQRIKALRKVVEISDNDQFSSFYVLIPLLKLTQFDATLHDYDAI